MQIVVETPTNLTPEQDQLLRKLAEISKTPVAGPRKGFLGKMKDLFGGDGPPNV